MMTTEQASSSMGLRFPEYILSPSKFPEMTQEEKEEFIEQLCHSSEKAQERLRSLKRNEIIELINIENGRERKFTSIPKRLLINHLCGIISDKISENENHAVASTDLVAPSSTLPLPPLNAPTSVRSKRKSCNPSPLPSVKYCDNSACRAEMKLMDNFCKRCSCYMCSNYDENKNPSFWLVCESKTSSQDNTCGLSCHLECALKDEREGKDLKRRGTKLDGSYQCGNCGNVNDLISCCRKLLMEAKDVRRVNDLCSRIYLSHKILSSTEKYLNLHEAVGSIKRKLEDEVGVLNNLPFNMSHSLVRRLPVYDEVLTLCSHAINLLDSLPLTPPRFNHIELQHCEAGATSEAIKPQNREAEAANVGTETQNCEAEPTNEAIEPQNCEAQATNESNPEVGISAQVSVLKDQNCEAQATNESNPELGISAQVSVLKEDKSERKKTVMIDLNELPENQRENDNSADGKLEHGALQTVKNEENYIDTVFRKTVNAIRKLECDGYIEKNFRMEFLTWLSIRATIKNAMLVGVFIDTFSDDPHSLAEQLVHTFGEEVSSKKPRKQL
ncbi:uncharacterized protein A4U43_C01F580 [Asparagus officinalis]|uniref:Uncharacterized protein n=1 Tax=Asparagus officinalis TaxID=4686 RepID=A0A5P1FKP0_ASPOF|nr:VIN3-like protein 2 [Asparagus officinalis]ONK78885.1 uncharacterized protein A4U43_C01F580 [Asparagus officinalis]